MRVLLDECVDRRCKVFFPSVHEVLHVSDVGLHGTKNGQLLRKAAESFDYLLTIDTKMPFQTNAKGLRIAIAIMPIRAQSLEAYEPYVQRFLEIAEQLPVGEFTVI
ncbi:MAG TPA: DUF5615 family PIN-like protein [Fimbriimonadaceae bacterium]